MTWWQLILVIFVSLLGLSILVEVWWNSKTKYIRAFNEGRPRHIFEQRKERDG